jgi:hypothetical protein
MPTQPAILGTARLGNFRLGYQPASLAARRRTVMRLVLGGIDARTRVRVGSVTVHDEVNDAPNTASFALNGPAPSVGQDVRILINSDAPILLFNGQLQTVDLTYEGLPGQLACRVTAIDDTARANYQRPFGTWTNVSATTVAQELIATFAPSFTTHGVAADLPAISVNFDGNEGLSAALAQIAKLIGGAFYFEDLDLHLFQTETTDPPADLTDTGGFLNDPPITVSTDDSQLRTRVYGKGHGEATLSDVDAGATIVPVENAAAWFTPGGGLAISETQRLAYTGVHGGGDSAVVGPGVSPSSPPMVAAAPGLGLDLGVYQYAYTDVTATGETLLSPLGTITTAPLAPPATTPVSSERAGTGVTVGTHLYAFSFVTAAGETTPGPTLSVVTAVTSPLPEPFNWNINANNISGGALSYAYYSYAITFVDAAGGETTQGNSFTNWFLADNLNHTIFLNNVPTSPNAATVKRKLYRTIGGHGTGWFLVATINNNTTSTYSDGLADASVGAALPLTNTAVYTAQQVTVFIFPGSSAVTGRNIYRTVAGGSQLKLLTTITDNILNSYVDSTPDASLGADAPTVNTAAMNQVALSAIAVAVQPEVTARNLYRTAVNGAQLKFLHTLSDNTTTTYLDSAADGTLGAVAHTTNTSGLGADTQPGAAFVSTGVAFSTNGAATVANTTAPVFSSASYTFVAADVGAFVFIKSGTSWTVGSYLIVSVAAGKATLDRACASVASPTFATWGVDYSGLTDPRVTFTDLVIDATTPTKCTSAAFPFGFNDIGNTITVTGGLGFSLQQVTVVSVSGVIATCDKVLGTVGSTGGRGTLGGAATATFVAAGASSIPMANTGPFPTVGGWLVVGTAPPMLYTTVDGGSLAGIPSTGPGAITAPIPYGSLITSLPALSGVTGLARPLIKGAPVNIWVQRDDLAAQAARIALDAAQGRTSDGVVEGPPVVDERRDETSLTALCDATLALYSAPIATVTYATRDVRTKSGKTIVVRLTQPPMNETLLIQSVEITEIDIADGLAPRFTATASTVRVTLESMMRGLL